MGARLAIRQDIPAEDLRRLGRQESNRRVACRLLGVANALDGMSRGQAARQAGMDRQTLRDWVIRFNAEGVEACAIGPRVAGRPGWMKASWRLSRRWCCGGPRLAPRGDRRWSPRSAAPNEMASARRTKEPRRTKAAGRRSLGQGGVRPGGVGVGEPRSQRRGALVRGRKGARIGPLTQASLDEALGLAVGPRRIRRMRRRSVEVGHDRRACAPRAHARSAQSDSDSRSA
jgi:hypothetical protein